MPFYSHESSFQSLSPLSSFGLFQSNDNLGAETHFMCKELQHMDIHSTHNVELESMEFSTYIESSHQVHMSDSEGNTELLTAMKNMELAQVHKLLLAGANVNVQNYLGESALSVAVELAIVQTISLLLTFGANVNIQDIDGNTPLHIAAGYGSQKIVVTLLHHGAFIDQKNIEGETALHCAVIGGHLDMCELLIKAGADLNALNDDRETPLDLANCFELPSIVEILVMNNAVGCDLDFCSKMKKEELSRQ